jgi:transposase
MYQFQQLYLEIQKKVSELENEVQNLRSENIALKTENRMLSQENAQLKERLGLNSKNSSIPPSKELYKLKKANKEKSPLKQGGQAGHKGYSRDKMVADEIIKIDLDSKHCECGGEIRISAPHIQQKIDLPEIKPYCTEYHLQRGRCKVCHKRKTSKLPNHITPDLFGPRVKAAISALTGFYKNSKREVESILKDIFNLQISLGSVSNSEGRVSLKCKEKYEEIEVQLSHSKLLHIDETSHYNKGKLGWCWLFGSTDASMIKLTDSRGKKILIDSVFGKSDNIIVTDRYAAYNYFAEENRQICWSHLARDFERFAHSSRAGIKVIGEYLRHMAAEVFFLKKALLAKEIDVLRFTRRARKIRKRTWYYLKEISHQQEAAAAARVAKNIMKSENMMWKFLDDPMVIPLTNNHAEQQIRHYVTYRKNSYFTQSERGNRFLERIISVFLTWKKQNCNPVKNLQNLLIA